MSSKGEKGEGAQKKKEETGQGEYPFFARSTRERKQQRLCSWGKKKRNEGKRGVANYAV